MKKCTKCHKRDKLCWENYNRSNKIMKKKKVWRYYCEYCKKSNCSAPAMTIHEKHCTMNPNRVCRMCKLLDEINGGIRFLIKALSIDMINIKKDATEIAIDNLRDAANNCPACILAVLRQYCREKDMVIIQFNFNYKEELESFWADYNESQRRY